MRLPVASAAAVNERCAFSAGCGVHVSVAGS